MFPALRSWLSFSMLAFVALPALAAPPTLTRISPRGAERGKATELVIAGANLTPQSRLVLPFKGTATRLPDAKPNLAQVRFQLTVDPTVPLGFYPLRLVTEDGVSSLFFFCVDAFPNVNELEDNTTFAMAQKVAAPVVVNGECLGGDVDFLRFAAKKGQRLMIEAEAARLGSGVLPQLRLTDDRQRFLAADDSQALAGDCRIHFTAPADGEYVVEISDSRYKGAAPAFYRLKIAEYDVAGEVFPLGGKRGETVTFVLRGGSLPGEVRVQRKLEGSLTAGRMPLSLEGAAKPGALPTLLAVADLPERIWLKPAGQDMKPLDVQPPLVVNGRLDKAGAIDRVQFPVQPGQRYRIAVEAESLGSALDGVLRITDQAGKQLALVDDVDLPPLVPGQPGTKRADPALDFTVPAGTTQLVLELRDQRRRGGLNFGYRLTIEPATADFALRQAVAEINVPRGGSAVLNVPVDRRGYTGPVQLSVPNLPAGFTVQGGDVPANAAAGVLSITGAPGTAAEPISVRVQGKAMVDGREIQRWAEHKIILSREANPAASVLSLSNLTLALTSANSFRVQGPPAIEAVKGFPVPITVVLAREPAAAALPIQVTGFLSTDPGPPPPNLYTLPPLTVAAGAANGTLTLTPRAPAPEGKLNLILQGKARIKNVDQIVFSQAVPLTIHAPFTIVINPATLALVPGQIATLKGKVMRHPSFTDAVQLRLDGLPAGVALTKPLAPLAANVSDFQIELKVDPKYKTPTANLSLTASTRLGGVPYARPPLTVTAALAK